jgi:hypothetical protein
MLNGGCTNQNGHFNTYKHIQTLGALNGEEYWFYGTYPPNIEINYRLNDGTWGILVI